MILLRILGMGVGFFDVVRTEETTKIYGSIVDVVLLEGILLFHHPSILPFFDMVLYCFFFD